MGFRVIKGGMLTTVQDFGRSGFQSQGFSVGGAMDVRSFKIANLLLDNPENEAELEITLIGMVILFVSLLILWGVMELLVRLVKDGPKDEAEEEAEAIETADADDDEKLKAAAAAAACVIAKK